MEALFDKFKNMILSILVLPLKILNLIYNKYLDLSMPDKIIFLNSFLAFFAIILPVARYYIFETYFYINNPLAVYMIGIVLIMFISLYYRGSIKLIIRLLINSYYLFWIVYIPLAGELTKADPHEICIGYYINIAVSIIFIISSLLSYYYSYE